MPPHLLFVGTAIVLACCGAAAAQVQQLPLTDGQEALAQPWPTPDEEIIVFPPSTAVQVVEETDEPASDLAAEARNGFFQRLSFDSTWLAGGGQNGLGVTDLDTRLSVAVPMPSREWPMLVTPGFGVHFLEAPAADLPPRVYDAFVQFRWFPKFSSRFLLDVTATPGVFGDFDRNSGDGFRASGHIAGVWTVGSRARWAAGIAYLDRHDMDWLPVGGLMWTSGDRWKLDLLFPEPRIARRVDWFEHWRPNVSDWVYIAGEFGDWVWAIQRSDGREDRVAYRDARLILGFERKALHQLSGRMEIGYVFDRRIDYENTGPDVKPDATLLLRGGVSY